jgi:hypothetical protein
MIIKYACHFISYGMNPTKTDGYIRQTESIQLNIHHHQEKINRSMMQ